MYSIDHRDLGTPPAKSADSVTLEIDGASVTVPAGTSIMRAAALADAQIPKLCATDSLKAFGSCRLCLVEVEGRKGFPASCTTLVAPDMKVRTQSPKLQQLRRNVVELYVSDHPLDCDDCPANGHCELQDAAEVTGVTQSRWAPGKSQRGVAPDVSNPYFDFNPDLCIVCSRCVRACDETQSTLALTIEGRGFGSRVSASEHQPFLASECVSCGACVEACPTAALSEKSLATMGAPQKAVTTTCGYCGVGCSLKAEVKDEQVIRMVPNRAGAANQGHACIKGRFAYGYATHKDRVTKPMIRERITDPWREVSWEEAFEYTAREFRRIQQKYGRNSVGGITSSRCTNEETYLVQKLVRAALLTNNVDTCARVCHSPTGYGLKHTLGESAGTQAFTSVQKADVVVVVGANPTDGHPVFGSQLKRRLRQGAKLIVIDPRAIDLVKTPHIEAAQHLQLRPGTNVAVINALAHVIVTEGLTKDDYALDALRDEVVPASGRPSSPTRATRRRPPRRSPAFPPRASARPRGCMPPARTAPSTMASASPSTARARPWSWASRTSRWRPATSAARAWASIRCADRTTCRAPATWARSRTSCRATGTCRMPSRVASSSRPGTCRSATSQDFASRTCSRRRSTAASARSTSRARTSPSRTRTRATWPRRFPRWNASSCRTCSWSRRRAMRTSSCRVRPSSRRTARSPTPSGASRGCARSWSRSPELADWEVTMRLAQALGYPMNYSHPSEIMDEIARLTPTFTGVSYEELDRLGSIQWPCNEKAPEGTPTMHVDSFVRGKGKFYRTEYVATAERSTSRYPLLLTTGRVLYQYNVGTQTRRTKNLVFNKEDVLEMHPDDAEARGIQEGDLVGVASRAGEIVVRASLTRRIARGVVYTTFHFPESGVNLVTTENSDWATNCPEYKVTAVEVAKVTQPDAWRERARATRAARKGASAHAN